MKTDITLPDLGIGPGAVHVSAWLVDVGDRVEAGEQVVEVLAVGMTFDVSAPVSGVVAGILTPAGAAVTAGGVMAWME